MTLPTRSTRHQFLLAFSIIVGLNCGSAVLAEKAPVQVYILAGQSNMVGEGMGKAIIELKK